MRGEKRLNIDIYINAALKTVLFNMNIMVQIHSSETYLFIIINYKENSFD
jgi:hypothetical protein